MTTSYPAALDAFTNPTGVDLEDSVTVPHADQHANANDAIEALEGELGVLPKGADASVKARLDRVDADVAGIPAGPTGAAGSSAYQVAVTGGFVGTEADWLLSLTGATGATGAAGTNGTNGAVGATGATGAGGVDGLTVLNGADVPAVGNGVNGDFWINTTLNTIHGPKAAGVWPAAVSLVGPTGPQGLQGVGGDVTIHSGIVGPVGADGLDGDFWIDSVLWLIYGPKAVGVWPAGNSIVGAAGAAGAAGAQGVQGVTGVAGVDGMTVLSGAASPTTQGVDGDFWINTTLNTIHGPKAAGVWPAAVSLVGPTGAAGAVGAIGPTGVDTDSGTGGWYKGLTDPATLGGWVETNGAIWFDFN